MKFDFTGNAVIVTGAARGIGRAMVKTFYDAGAMVFAADREAEGLAETCEVFPERVESIVADISTPEGAQSIISGCIEAFGGLDVCVNNAAVAPNAWDSPTDKSRKDPVRADSACPCHPPLISSLPWRWSRVVRGASATPASPGRRRRRESPRTRPRPW